MSSDGISTRARAVLWILVVPTALSFAVAIGLHPDPRWLAALRISAALAAVVLIVWAVAQYRAAPDPSSIDIGDEI